MVGLSKETLAALRRALREGARKGLSEERILAQFRLDHGYTRETLLKYYVKILWEDEHGMMYLRQRRWLNGKEEDG